MIVETCPDCGKPIHRVRCKGCNKFTAVYLDESRHFVCVKCGYVEVEGVCITHLQSVHNLYIMCLLK